jgi:hypothetical protein
MLFAEAAELRMAEAAQPAALLGPRLLSWRRARLRRRLRGCILQALADGGEVPLGLLVCWAWPSPRWLRADRLALASLSLDSTASGRLVYARTVLAREAARGACAHEMLLTRAEGLLERVRPLAGSRPWAWHAVTRGALHAHRGEVRAALAAYARAASVSGALGLWARGLALGLALVIGDRDILAGLRLARRDRNPKRASRDTARNAMLACAAEESLADVRDSLRAWNAVLERDRGASASPPMEHELFEMIVGEDDLASGVAFLHAAHP